MAGIDGGGLARRRAGAHDYTMDAASSQLRQAQIDLADAGDNPGRCARVDHVGSARVYVVVAQITTTRPPLPDLPPS